MAKVLISLIQFILVLQGFAQRNQDERACINPNGQKGECVTIFECKPLAMILVTQQSSSFNFLNMSICSPITPNRRGMYVCCTADTNFKKYNDVRFTYTSASYSADFEVTAKAPPKTSNSSLFPTPPLCGPVLASAKIVGGEEAELGEFPWLANLIYRKRDRSLISACVGNILNQRYVLTVAHCVVGEIRRKIGKLVALRVGVHNKEATIDCDSHGCLDPPQLLSVVEAIVHENYNNYPYKNRHDIALLRTDRNIQYSFSVAPVCLPNVFEQLPEWKSGTKLSVAGWGTTGVSYSYSPVKLKVVLPYVKNEDCFLNVAPEQLCAGGENNKDSCSGDSGSGLVRLFRNAWVVEGLVSYGRSCGLETPAVYTRISTYINWIHDNVRP